MSEGKHLRHWEEVYERYIAVLDFIEFINYEYGLTFDWEMADQGTPLDIRKLLDQFFEVDQAELENERRQLLEEISKKNEGSLRQT